VEVGAVLAVQGQAERIAVQGCPRRRIGQTGPNPATNKTFIAKPSVAGRRATNPLAPTLDHRR
jgi:hypothetical protein